MPSQAQELAPRTKIAIAGGGRRCLSLLQILESERLHGLDVKVVGVADRDPEAVGFVHAQKRGIFVTTDYRELFNIKELELIIDLSGSESLWRKLMTEKPDAVRVLDYTTSRLFQEIVEGFVSYGLRLRQQENEISVVRSLSQAMLRATSEGVMVLDPDYRIIWANETALKMAGVSREEVQGRFCFQLSHQAIAPCDSPETPCPMKQTMATGQEAHAIHEHARHGQESLFCDVSTYPILNREGEVVEVLEVFRDITAELSDKFERRTRAIKDDLARMVQEDKLIALGKLVASVAHEINNPIASIINFTKLILKTIQEGRPSDEDLAAFEKHLDLTVREAQRCGKIVNNLLAFSRLNSKEPRLIDLEALLERIIVLTQHQMELSNVELKVELTSTPLKIWGDYTQIQQCLTNLVFNALEAMPLGGRLSIRGGRDERAWVWLEVADTGEGISPENMPYIFEPFFSTKPEGRGVGLGLSMVYGIIKDHKGEISVHSEPGQGATFRLTLPAGSGRFEAEVRP